MKELSKLKTPEGIVLANALRSLNGGRNWTTRRLRRVEDGQACFCSFGAVLYTPGPFCNTMRYDAADFLTAAAQEQGFDSEVKLNDHPTTEWISVEVMFNRAIELAESRAA